MKKNTGNFTRNWYVPNIDRIKEEFGLSAWTPINSLIEYMKKKLEQ